MAFTLTMPEVGETVTEGTVERWLKKPGDRIDKYEPVVEVNTDKVDVELPSPVSGTLKEILVEEGAVVKVGAALAVIDEVGVPEAMREEAAPAEAKPADEAKPPAAARAERRHRGPAEAAERPGRHRATPRVRRVAEELGVDLAVVQGTGPGGRILEEDVRAFAGKAAAGAAPAPGPPPKVEQEEEAVPLTSIRRTIAQRMAASKFSAPHAWMMMEADVTGLVRLREARREEFRQKAGTDLTYLPFVINATAEALREQPMVNASWAEDKIVLKKRIHVGVAVAAEQGLLVPVIHDADRLSIAGLAQATADLAARARAGKLRLEDVQGGTFTVDNTGWFGSVVSMPIINQGQAAILAMEAITKRPVVLENDAIAVRSVMNLCLSFDHRILDGAIAGNFLGAVKSRLEAVGPERPLY
ncbi:MAG: 2-oxo acid dehydrogenase subunit E2 [Chloroflexi bacterium]|nr:2-oxo acid dehydrogenase subunit E2 [Chloroflexota bacterium]